MLKSGDKVKITDTSYSFGIRKGKYNEPRNCLKEETLTVVKTGLCVGRKPLGGKLGNRLTITDILVTDNSENYWFVQSERVRKIAPEHTIVIDGKTIIISDASFQALRTLA